MSRAYPLLIAAFLMLTGSCGDESITRVNPLGDANMPGGLAFDPWSPVYVDDPPGVFADINTGDRSRHLHAWTKSGFTFNFGTTQHIQGIARFPLSNWMVLSGNPSDQGRIALVHLASRPGLYLLGSNSRPPSADDKLVSLITVSERFGHAGGLSTCGNVLAVPVEADTSVQYYEGDIPLPTPSDTKQSEIHFFFAPPENMEGIYDLSDSYPAAIIKRYYRGGPTPQVSDYESRGAGVVALTRLLTGPYANHYLVAIHSGGHDELVEFYVSKTTTLTDGFKFASSAESDWFILSGPGCQNLNFVVGTDGSIYLFCSANTEASGVGDDKARFARVNFVGGDPHEPAGASTIEPQGELHFECDDSYGNFAAASGLYTSQYGKLAVYASIHSTYGESGGPSGYDELIMMTEFPWAPTPPVADAGPDQTLSADEECMAAVTLDGSASYDADGDALTYAWSWGNFTATGVSPTISLPLGTTTITLVVNDGTFDSSPDYVDVTVVDDTPPELALSVDPESLWPPNHKMVPVTVIAIATDNCDPSPVSVITSVSCNEDVDGRGDGHTSPDWVITGDLTLGLRAERSGAGSGRVYTIEVQCTDASGNTTFGTIDVVVPHDMGS